MELYAIIWHIVLTVCTENVCRVQDIQWFDNKQACYDTLQKYEEIPWDGHWDVVQYECKIMNRAT